MNELEKLCPQFLQTPNAAGIIAFLFNDFMTLEMRNAVPEDVAEQIGRYLHSRGYRIVFNRFYKQCEEQILESVQQDYEEVMEDHRRLVRELDVLINGEEGAAQQASLCDIVAQVKREGLKVAKPAVAQEPVVCNHNFHYFGDLKIRRCNNCLELEPDWREPTDYIERFTEAIALMCSKKPPKEIVTAWLDKTKDDMRLQEFAIEHGPAWAQGIAILDAANIMANQPAEGIEHEFLEEPPAVAVNEQMLEALKRVSQSTSFWYLDFDDRQDVANAIAAAEAAKKGGV